MELSFILFFLIALIFSIIIHEVSHGFAAEMLGDPTARLQGRLTLNPIPHIDIMGSILVPAFLVYVTITTGFGFLFGWAKPVPYNPYNLNNRKWGEAIVAASGPGVNILIAVAFGLVIRVGLGSLPEQFILLASLVVFINILLAFFNLLPIPPLDGSKILRSVLPYKANMAFQRFEAIIMRGGLLMMILVFWLLMTLVGSYFFLLLEAIFILITGIQIPF